ncbi:MAG: hypothetical protein OCD00_11230 [Colwellia sp.]
MINQRILKAAISNCRLSGLEVTDDMIRKLKQALNDNPDILPEKLITLLLNEGRREVKIPCNLKHQKNNFITLDRARKKRTSKPKR